MNQSTSNLNRPDLLENETVKKNQRDAKSMSAAIRRAASINTENQNIKDRLVELFPSIMSSFSTLIYLANFQDA